MELLATGAGHGRYLDVLWHHRLVVFFDRDRHHLPHIHVKYQEQEAVLSIPDGNLLEGELKGNKMKLVQAWIEIHRDELMANWDLASNGEGIFRIDPLR